MDQTTARQGGAARVDTASQSDPMGGLGSASTHVARAPGRLRARVGGWNRLLASCVLALALVSTGGLPAMADDYDEKRAGHPLRIIAYALHPVGVALDYLIFRPAHWIASHEPLQTLFGHEED